MSQPVPESDDAYEAWMDLQAVLEERDREYWETDDHEGPDGRP